MIGAETFSRILDWEDRATCVLFGDGAGRGGAQGRGVAEDGPGILATRLHADGEHGDLLYVDGGPSTTGTVGKVRMKGREVFRHAVTNLAEVLNEVLGDAGHSAQRIDWVVPHQANRRILDATARKLGLPMDKVVITVDRHANTSAASVPLAFDDGEARRADQAGRPGHARGDGRRVHLGRQPAAAVKFTVGEFGADLANKVLFVRLIPRGRALGGTT